MPTTTNHILSLLMKRLIATGIVFHFLFLVCKGQEINWANTLTFDHTGSAFERLVRYAPHLDYLVGTARDDRSPDLQVIAEFAYPVDVAHVYLLTEDFNDSIEHSVLLNVVDVETVLPHGYTTVFAFENKEMMGFREQTTGLISGSIQRIVFTISGSEAYNEPKIIAVGTSSDAQRKDRLSSVEIEVALSSIKKMKVNHVRPEAPATKSGGTISYYSVKEKLGPNVNTVFEEVKPLISPDGSVLYFARKGTPSNVKGIEDQDIYCSVLLGGEWAPAFSIGHGLNDRYPNGVCSVSPDGARLLLMNAYDEKGRAYDGVSIAQKTSNGWSEPEGQIIEGFVNYSAYQDFALNITGEVLLMAIENETTYGGQDLYVSFRKDGNTWTKPVNLGPVINTDQQEYAPFISADNKTLYLSSDGHGGYGAGDILMSTRLDDSWTRWTPPENIGAEVNSESWEGYFTIPLRGDYAYFTSGSRSTSAFTGTGEMDEDIYRIAINEAIKPDPVIVLMGNVYDDHSKAPIYSKIEYQMNTVQQSTSSHSQTGLYRIVLPLGQKLHMHTVAEGYLPEKLDEDFSGITEYTVLRRDFYLKPVDVGQTFLLNNLFFVQSKSELLPESYPEINRIFDLLVQNPEMEIELGGHTDNTGISTANLRLSRERAEAVRNYLMQLGIDGGRIRAEGYGEKKPIASNKDPESRKQNRRVEVKILKR